MPTIAWFCGMMNRRAERPVWQGHEQLRKLRDDPIMPVIGPTCQNIFAGQGIHAGDPRYLCMGLFSIFLVERVRPGTAAGRSLDYDDREPPHFHARYGRAKRRGRC